MLLLFVNFYLQLLSIEDRVAYSNHEPMEKLCLGALANLEFEKMLEHFSTHVYD